MTEAEVLAILGKPIKAAPRPPDDTETNVRHLYWWIYGEITFRSYATTAFYSYCLDFHQGRVVHINDPWNGKFSEDDRPTVPELLFPGAERTFDHFPRFMDFRWHPSSGTYPMDYEVVIQSLSISHYDADHFEDYIRRNIEEGRQFRQPQDLPEAEVERSLTEALRARGGVLDTYQFRTHDIYLPFTWVGANTGRWRVRAVNAKGVSEWTEWRYFEFAQ